MRLQSRITAELEKRTYRIRCGDQKTKARLLSAGQSGAYAWLRTMPSEHPFRLADLEVVRALRHRMGVAPIDTKPTCACGVVVTDHNFDHFHSCHMTRQEATTARHDVVQQALAGVAAEAGVASKMDYSSSGTRDKDGSRLNPDGVLFGLHPTGADVVTDVAVSNPTCDSYIAKTAAAIQPLSAAAHMEDVKRHKYSDYLTTKRSVLRPFVVESYGAIGVWAKKILADLVRRAEERVVPTALDLRAFSFAQWATRVIAVAIQRGNSRLVDVALRASARRRGL